MTSPNGNTPSLPNSESDNAYNMGAEYLIYQFKDALNTKGAEVLTDERAQAYMELFRDYHLNNKATRGNLSTVLSYDVIGILVCLADVLSSCVTAHATEMSNNDNKGCIKSEALIPLVELTTDKMWEDLCVLGKRLSHNHTHLGFCKSVAESLKEREEKHNARE